MAVVSKEMSAARKLGTRTRTSTPSMMGTQIQASEVEGFAGGAVLEEQQALEGGGAGEGAGDGRGYA